MTEVKNEQTEKEHVSRDVAKNLAKTKGKGADPLPDIKPSLLSAEHIRDYVEEIGLISPFFLGAGGKSRLKKAAYEGRIGECAYMYDGAGNLIDVAVEPNLIVPANSIVFVECDLDFRLPEYIALRFNLQIRHVHRGLLLGTGPLVDPGFWGKLCIPLHNLTDHDYVIPLDEGLIWIEFTKTTSNIGAVAPIGRPPLVGQEFDNIKAFIRKASRSLVDGPDVPIRSSIPVLFEKARLEAKSAANSAKKAKAAAEKTQFIGLAAGLAVTIGVVALWSTFFFGTNSQFTAVDSRVFQLERHVANGHTGDVEFANDRVSFLEDEIEKLTARILELEDLLDLQEIE